MFITTSLRRRQLLMYDSSLLNLKTGFTFVDIALHVYDTEYYKKIVAMWQWVIYKQSWICFGCHKYTSISQILRRKGGKEEKEQLEGLGGQGKRERGREEGLSVFITEDENTVANWMVFECEQRFLTQPLLNLWWPICSSFIILCYCSEPPCNGPAFTSSMLLCELTNQLYIQKKYAFLL